MTGPFTHDVPDEIPLSQAPLVKVLVQMKFPVIAKIDSSDGIQGFQEQLRQRYPIMRQEQQFAMTLPPGIPAAPAGFGILWRLADADGVWSVILARDFVAIETNVYGSRSDFIDRWTEVLTALDVAGLSPSLTDRIGMRYIDRLTGSSSIDELPVLVRSELLGLTTVEIPEGSEMLSHVSQSHFQLDGMQMKVSWGVLPPGATLLPGLEPVAEKSWVLDVDVFREHGSTYSIDAAVTEINDAAERAYVFFRWAVTEEFLRRHGGNV